MRGAEEKSIARVDEHDQQNAMQLTSYPAGRQYHGHHRQQLPVTADQSTSLIRDYTPSYVIYSLAESMPL